MLLLFGNTEQRREGMRTTEAKIILRCQKPRYIKQIWRSLVAFDEGDVSYQEIAHSCEKLFIKSYLLRNKRGKTVYYRATKQAIQEAVAVMNKIGEDRQKSVEKMRIMNMNNNRQLTEFV